MSRQLLPVFLTLTGRRVLVVGGGPVAESKLAALVAAGADVTVVAPEIRATVRDYPVTLVERPFEDEDVDGAWFVVAAAPPEINRAVARAAESRRVFVNAADDPASASAYLGGVVRRDGVTVAVSTDGRAPALAGLLREGLDALLPRELEAWLATSDACRRVWKAAAVPMPDRRPQLLAAINALYDERHAPAGAGAGR